MRPHRKSLPEVFEADAEVVKRGGRNGRDEHPSHQRVRNSDGDDVGRALIDVSPEQSAREGRDREPRVRQAKHGEGKSKKAKGKRGRRKTARLSSPSFAFLLLPFDFLTPSLTVGLPHL